jgi:hypothetical protein
MNYLIEVASLIGIFTTAIVLGTDMFFFTVGRFALRRASPSGATEVMGFMHLFGDRRMPVWGVLAILSNACLAVFSEHGHRATYLASVLLLVLFALAYGRLSKPINRLQTEAAQTGRTLNDARSLQASWDRSLLLRVPLLSLSMLAQCIALLSASASVHA